MTQESIPTYRYPDEMGRIILLAMQEVMGTRAVNAILSAAGMHQTGNRYPSAGRDVQPGFTQISRIQSALEEIYGKQGGQGLALRCGRVSFKYGLREYGEQSGCTNLEFRLLPFNARLRAGSDMLAKMLNENSGQTVRVSDQGEHYVWEIERCPVCLGRHAESVSCHLTVGVLQESLFWISGGKFFNVEETHCIAKGDPTCTILVNKKPLD
jgi:predicted hydrocarbon binding protein